jgi:uncharacterized membrane protein YcaP (DUF421 family)
MKSAGPPSWPVYLPVNATTTAWAAVVLAPAPPRGLSSWAWLLEGLQSRYPSFERLVRYPKLKLIENGRMLRHNMRQEFVSVDELMAELREQGVEDCLEVKAAYTEANGHISVIRRDGNWVMNARLHYRNASMLAQMAGLAILA